MVFNDVFQSAPDVAILNVKLSLAVVGAAESRRRLRFREEVTGGKQVRVAQLFPLLQQSQKSAFAFLLQHDLLVYCSDVLVEKYLSAVLTACDVLSWWRGDFGGIVPHQFSNRFIFQTKKRT